MRWSLILFCVGIVVAQEPWDIPMQIPPGVKYVQVDAARRKQAVDQVRTRSTRRL